MNNQWTVFLSEELISNDKSFSMTAQCTEKSVFPLTHLGVLKVSGNDAGRLLQGQMTCNINDVAEAKSTFAAMCNPKGRVIATLLIIRKSDYFLLLLSTDLVETVKTKLKMYILRSAAKIEDGGDDLCVFGLREPGQPAPAFTKETHENSVVVNLPGPLNRKLLLTDADNAIQLWTRFIGSEGYRQADSSEWRYFDILSGIPWVTAATSEEYIPQMLNIDKLGGISFNKGCYTGQEIVARMHYLGKNKRELALAECRISLKPEPNTGVVNQDGDGQDVVGWVLQSEKNNQNPENYILLIVLQNTEAGFNNLALADDERTQLTLLPLTYD